MLAKRLFYLIIAVCFIMIAVPAFAANPTPPKDILVAEQNYKNVADNAWTNLEFPKDIQPSGLYYIEMTGLIGTIGCWGSKKNPYENGPDNELLTAWRDGVPLEAGNADFRLQYRPKKLNTWVELIIIAPQGAIVDAWYPFGLHEAQESIGQTFIAPEDFTGVGLQTPTWVTVNSGCTMTLYAAELKKQSVEPGGKLSVEWGKIKMDL